MYDNWIYNHLINNAFFILVCLSFPLAYAIWLLFAIAKINKEDENQSNKN